MISALFAKIIGTSNDRILKKIQPIVDQINQFESHISLLKDEELCEKTNEFRQQLSNGKSLDDILPEAFAVVREVAKRKLGQRHHDVQLIGGIVLHQGKIAEMKTGEGKTLTATLPLYLNALTGNSAILVTVNDYLARRDADWMRPIFEGLGLTVGVIQNSMHDSERKTVYQSDIVYATNNELGFDYLRDNMKFRLKDYVQQPLCYAIVDEVDSILIDEARTPLIISGSSDDASDLYNRADYVIRKLKKGEDYELDEKQRNVMLTESGNDKVESLLNVNNLYAIENVLLFHHISQALRAHVLYHKDVEYVVRDNEVLIVDEFTGRILPGRRYSDGLHQALEVKENVDVNSESQTLASITLQNFFRLFTKLSGMTGTAMTEAEEFYNIYKLDVISVPTNKPMIRVDKPDLIFLSEHAKFKAIINDIKERQKKGQPVLIGTIAIEKSEKLSAVLTAERIPHSVLNAKQHEREAEIIAHAGELGHVVIATNMAGRGTDIKLSPESLKAGGLYILGTERHESRRIDNQLRGRSGRQGDAGESRFYISLEDELIRIFAGDQLKNTMQQYGMEEDEVIESSLVSKTIERAQERVEKDNFEVRKNLIEYDDVMNQHRKVIYQIRRNVLEGSEQIFDIVREMISSALYDACKKFAPDSYISKEQLDDLLVFISTISGIQLTILQDRNFNSKNYDRLQNDLLNYVIEQYSLRRAACNNFMISNAEKWIMIETIDQSWKQHMLNLEHLKEGISLRSWGQKNPLIEYKREAFTMFSEMMSQIAWEITHRIFTLEISHFDESILERKRLDELANIRMISAVDSTDGEKEVRRTEQKIGRNDFCSCGSGKKFKKCCNN